MDVNPLISAKLPLALPGLPSFTGVVNAVEFLWPSRAASSKSLRSLSERFLEKKEGNLWIKVDYKSIKFDHYMQDLELNEPWKQLKAIH